MTLTTFPNEIHETIFDYCNIDTLKTLSKSCIRFKNLTSKRLDIHEKVKMISSFKLGCVTEYLKELIDSPISQNSIGSLSLLIKIWNLREVIPNPNGTSDLAAPIRWSKVVDQQELKNYYKQLHSWFHREKNKPHMRVESFDFGSSVVVSLSREIRCFSNLSELICSPKMPKQKNGLLKIPEFIGNLKGLTSLNFSYNFLSDLPETITKLTNLKIFQLKYNRFSSFPLPILGCQNLVVLDLTHNRISQIPENFNRLTNLAILFLAENKFTELPQPITNLTKITKLTLNENQMTTLQNITNLTKLQIMNFDDDQMDFKEIQNMVSGLPSLENLNYSPVMSFLIEKKRQTKKLLASKKKSGKTREKI